MKKIFIIFDKASDKEVAFVPYLVDTLSAGNICTIRTRFMDDDMAISHIKEKLDSYDVKSDQAIIFYAGEKLEHIKKHFSLAISIERVIDLMTKVVGGNKTPADRELIGDFFVSAILQYI